MLEALRQARTRGRGLLALFAAGWLFAVASPCVMALEGLGEEPPAHDCPHCPEETGIEAGCGGAAPNGAFCDNGADWQHERRSLDLPELQPAVLPVPPEPDGGLAATGPPVASPAAPPPGAFPPRYLRHCSFLN